VAAEQSAYPLVVFFKLYKNVYRKSIIIFLCPFICETMKTQSYIEIAVPPGKEELTQRLIAVLTEEFFGMDIRIQESMNGKYQVMSAYTMPSVAVKDVNTGADMSSQAALSSAAEIIYQVTGDAP
jgi:hypothetical protein